ncbi:MAG: hypothetical protein RSE14_05505 [Erythrobacter sp.]|jgi:hypothetical protein|uniref:hypothetical protein n=1 Tax=Erythrobacter sp. TaxID=1042 RepID=UPI002B4938B7|nr:hypothetical protein [Erythrobacter sp.]WRH71551.1 MAG: hypothetical protein RSE14_05505 [Erythrobacter sp.]
MKDPIPNNKPLRAKAFGERFRAACDDSPHCPAKHQGRYSWIIERFKEKRGETISPETCRKWHEGEAQARRDKVVTLAKILDADPIWLETGHKSTESAENARYATQESPNSVSITIRPNKIVVIQNLPDDLSATEARRIARMVQAYVVEP